MDKLDGKVAVVTGSSRGIGKDMAIVFAREGASVVVSGRTEKEGDFRIEGSIQTTLDKITAEGGEALGIKCDVTKDEEVEALFQQSAEKYGRIDILVNNAAVLIPGQIETMQARHWDLLYRINVRAPFTCCQAVIPYMKEQQYGHIINISSNGALSPGTGPYLSVGQGGTAYGAGKAHLERFTQGLAREVWEYGIAVNALSPVGVIASEGQRWFRGSGENLKGGREDGEIMGDAAVVIIEQDPKVYTGRILYDETVLRDAGVTGLLSKYPIIT